MPEYNKLHWVRGPAWQPVADCDLKRARKDMTPSTNAERVSKWRVRKVKKDPDALRKLSAVAHTRALLYKRADWLKREHFHYLTHVKADAPNATEGKIRYLPLQPSQVGWQQGEVVEKHIGNGGVFLVVRQP